MAHTIRHGRWQITESRKEGRLQWELASSDTAITLRWPLEGSDTAEARIETDDGIDKDSFSISTIPVWLLTIDDELRYGKLCERLEDEA